MPFQHEPPPGKLDSRKVLIYLISQIQNSPSGSSEHVGGAAHLSITWCQVTLPLQPSLNWSRGCKEKSLKEYLLQRKNEDLAMYLVWSRFSLFPHLVSDGCGLMKTRPHGKAWWEENQLQTPFPFLEQLVMDKDIGERIILLASYSPPPAGMGLCQQAKPLCWPAYFNLFQNF